MTAEDQVDPFFMLEPFSVPVTPPVEYTSPADVAVVAAERRAALATHPSIAMLRGSQHRHYPREQSDGEPVAVITDPDLAGRLAAVVADPLPELAPLGDPSSDVSIYFPDPGSDDWWPALRVAGNQVRDFETGATWLVDSAKLADVLADAGVPGQFLPFLRETPVDWPPRRPSDGDALTQMWLERFPESRPVPYELKELLPDRWIRFHSLPESRQYAEDEQDYLEIIRRHRAVLTALPGPAEVLLISCSWSDGSAVDQVAMNRDVPVEQPWLWGTVVVEQEFTRLRCVDLWVERIDRFDPGLDLLFRMEADDATGGLMWVDPEMRWIFAPYDGGVDVIAEDELHRDELKSRFSTWLPANGGLY